MGCNWSNTLIRVSKVRAYFFGLAPGSPLEFTAEATRYVAVTRCSTVLAFKERCTKLLDVTRLLKVVKRVCHARGNKAYNVILLTEGGDSFSDWLTNPHPAVVCGTDEN